MNQLFLLLSAALIATAPPVDAATKAPLKPAMASKAVTTKKTPPVSNVRPEIKTPSRVDRRATITKQNRR